jgi:hypothetical protein
MSWIDAAGIFLSVLAVLVLIWMIADARRLWGAGSPNAGPAPAARWVWPAILVVSFLGGLFGVPIGGSPEIREEADASSYQQPVDTRWSTLRTPFYLAVRKEERSARGAWQVEARDASLQLPWTFLLGCLAYLFFRRGRMRSRDGFSRATRTGGRLSTG